MVKDNLQQLLRKDSTKRYMIEKMLSIKVKKDEMGNKGVENNFSSFPLHSFSYSVVKTFAFFFSLLPSTSKVISLCFGNINPACSKEQQLTGSASFRVSI